MEEIFDRMSIRAYLYTEIEDEKIEKLLRAAMAAPSAGNQQPWEFFVIKDRSIMVELSQCSPYANAAREAPLSIVACYNKDRLRFKEFADSDMSAAVENMLLEAVTQGLGAVWLGVAPIQSRMEFVKNALQLPDNLEAFAIVSIGYARPTRIPRMREDRYDPSRVHQLGETSWQ